MKPGFAWALVATAVVAGCSVRRHAVPVVEPELSAMNGSLLGPTEHEACGTYILFLDWGHLFVNEKAVRPGGLPLWRGHGRTREERRALYLALDAMPEATHVLPHRTHASTAGVVLFGHPIFGERCAVVRAHGLRVEAVPEGD